jgi:hypothetical protein
MAFIIIPLVLRFGVFFYPSDDTARPDVRRRAGLTIGRGVSSKG